MKVKFKIISDDNDTCIVSFFYIDPITDAIIKETHYVDYKVEKSDIQQLTEFVVGYIKKIEKRCEILKRRKNKDTYNGGNQNGR